MEATGPSLRGLFDKDDDSVHPLVNNSIFKACPDGMRFDTKEVRSTGAVSVVFQSYTRVYHPHRMTSKRSTQQLTSKHAASRSPSPTARAYLSLLPSRST